ncbi:MAG: nitrilase family protein [Muribaculaceae bacterium]|nr:nitrilase family protein [Muribaculaceae bacterium]MDE5930431.1 nitrilase family protein [Muribaculaceae bacterium]
MTFNNRLKIAVFPLDIKQSQQQENIEACRIALAKIEPDTDLVILPELFTTGFIADRDEALAKAEPYDDSNDHTLRQLAAMASDINAAICGSYLKLDPEGRPANHAVFMEPSGEYDVYYKHHLFGLSRESEFYGAGDKEPPVIRYRGWNISMVICYDLRFPTWCRNRNLKYDLLLIPANWPDSRRYAWEHLLIARAIENQAIVAGADRSGSDEYGVYPPEMSAVYDFMGYQAGTLSADGFIYATLHKDRLEQFRRRFPFYKDAD